MTEIKPGYFGKLPCAGDFVQQNLPGDMASVWDKWLQNSLLATQQALGDYWLDYYLVSPWWRFVLLPGVVSEQAWIGMWCPSVDRVGRYFPFTIMYPLERSTAPLETLISNAVWYEQLESLVSGALDQSLDFEQFRHGVDGLSFPEMVPALQSPMNGLAMDVPHTAAGPFQAACSYSSALMRQSGGKFSFWWTEGSTWVRPKLVSCEYLPRYQSFTAFIDGKWQQWGWQSQE